MRIYLTTILILLVSVVSLAQSTGQRRKSTTYSATSDWQKITLRSPVVTTASASVPPRRSSSSAAPSSGRSSSTDDTDFRPAFTGDFATNRNGWKAGNQGDYHYQIGLGRYSIRKRNVNTKRAAFSAIELPTEINLNQADVFTIKVDMLADSGQVPTGGLLFGVLDSLNYCAFTLNGKGEVSIIRVANGQTFSDYMPGDYFLPGVGVEKNRNRLMIERRGQGLRFYINAQEIRTSPYLFKMLAGNGIGMTASGYWTSFQKLSVIIGPNGSSYVPLMAPPTNPEPVSNTRPAAVSTSPKKTEAPDAPTTETRPMSAPVGLLAKEARPAVATFTGSFESNKPGWFTGTRKGYEFDIKKDSYSLRRLPGATQAVGRCYVELPAGMNLNKAESFTISVDMTVAPGQMPVGGLLFGVQDVENMVQFSIADKKNVLIKSLRAGHALTSYMPGNQVAVGVPINPDTNKLTIRKQRDKLYFYINDQEVQGSPYAFRPFQGNGIGFIVGASVMKFSNLSVMTQAR